MADDDWRATLQLGSDAGARGAFEGLRTTRVAAAAQERLGGPIVVSHDGPRIFLYASDGNHLTHALDAVRPLLAEHHAEAEVAIHRWHPLEERWEDPEVPMPETPDEVARERAAERARDEARSAHRGEPEWEVRIVAHDRHEAMQLETQLAGEGLAVVRRWSYLIVGATSEAGAHELYGRLREELPATVTLIVEGSATVAREELGFAEFSPFRFLGG